MRTLRDMPDWLLMCGYTNRSYGWQLEVCFGREHLAINTVLAQTITVNQCVIYKFKRPNQVQNTGHNSVAISYLQADAACLYSKDSKYVRTILNSTEIVAVT